MGILLGAVVAVDRTVDLMMIVGVHRLVGIQISINRLGLTRPIIGQLERENRYHRLIRGDLVGIVRKVVVVWVCLGLMTLIIG